MGAQLAQLPHAARRAGRGGKRLAAWFVWERRAAPVLRQIRLRTRQAENALERHSEECQACQEWQPCSVGAQLQRAVATASAPSSSEEKKILGARPLLEEVDQIIIGCWSELDSCRPLGTVAAGPIPWTAIVRWCELEDLDVDRMRIVARVIKHLDARRAERLTSELSLK